MTDAHKAEIFAYLLDLRDSGRVNMWGCAPYLMEAFDLDKREARDIFLEWIEHCRRVPT